MRNYVYCSTDYNYTLTVYIIQLQLAKLILLGPLLRKASNVAAEVIAIMVGIK